MSAFQRSAQFPRIEIGHEYQRIHEMEKVYSSEPKNFSFLTLRSTLRQTAPTQPYIILPLVGQHYTRLPLVGQPYIRLPLLKQWPLFSFFFRTDPSNSG